MKTVMNTYDDSSFRLFGCLSNVIQLAMIKRQKKYCSIKKENKIGCGSGSCREQSSKLLCNGHEGYYRRRY
jgi:hypothetical protein